MRTAVSSCVRRSSIPARSSGSRGCRGLRRSSVALFLSHRRRHRCVHSGGMGARNGCSALLKGRRCGSALRLIRQHRRWVETESKRQAESLTDIDGRPVYRNADIRPLGPRVHGAHLQGPSTVTRCPPGDWCRLIGLEADVGRRSGHPRASQSAAGTVRRCRSRSRGGTRIVSYGANSGELLT